MDQDKEAEIRSRAYQIWEEEGRPDDRHHDHWQRAEQDIGAGDGGTATAANSNASLPGMMGDGTEEQNLGQAGKPDARITQDEVEAAFKQKR